MMNALHGQSVSRTVEVETVVRIDVADVDGVLTRYTDGRYPHPYGLTTDAEIYEHLAYNAVANGVEHANVLDGWADLADDAATMRLEGISTKVRNV